MLRRLAIAISVIIMSLLNYNPTLNKFYLIVSYRYLTLTLCFRAAVGMTIFKGKFYSNVPS